MNKISIVAICLVFLSLGCRNEDDSFNPANHTPSTSLSKILPLGASRVEGARPDYESFRYELWKLLIDSEKDFDYIGTNRDDADYPNYMNQIFDVDHEGYGGFTSEQILEELEATLNYDIPDIVLLSSPGGNDALNGMSYDDAVDNINAIIDVLQTANPNVIIIIEQLAPAHSSAMTPDLTAFLENMQTEVLTIAAQQTTNQSTVIPVDMYTGFTDAYLADEVHYNEAGAAFIAERYYTVLEGLLE